jgi:hypothetical protein
MACGVDRGIFFSDGTDFDKAYHAHAVSDTPA